MTRVKIRVRVRIHVMGMGRVLCAIVVSATSSEGFSGGLQMIQIAMHSLSDS